MELDITEKVRWYDDGTKRIQALGLKDARQRPLPVNP
jgi:hypothetical protein